MNYLQPMAFLALFTLAACASTDNGKTSGISLEKSQQNNSENKTKEAAGKNTKQQKTSDKVSKSASATAQSAIISSQPTAQSRQIAGLYFARLPCPNCGMVRVNLVLEPNFTYDKTEEYLANNEIFFDNGSWAYKDSKVMLFPAPNGQDTQSTIRLFRYENSQLSLLTADGKPFSGKPEDYRFKKK